MNGCLQSHKTRGSRGRNPLSLAAGSCGLLTAAAAVGVPSLGGMLEPLGPATKGNGKCVLQVSSAVLTVLTFGSAGLQLTC